MQAYFDNPPLIKAPIGRQPYSLLPTSEHAGVDDLVRLRKKRRAKRFWHAFVATACLGYLVYLASKHTGIFHKGHCGDNRVDEMGQIINGMKYTIPKNLSLVQCVDAEDWTETSIDLSDFLYASETSFDLPLDSATLFLISRGQNLGGAVNVLTSEDQAKESAKVSISLYYVEEKVRDWTKVCLLSRDKDENGIGVFTPLWKGGRHWNRRSHRINYQITVTLPAPISDNSPLQIKHLETDLPNTSHRLGDLSNVGFERISLRATNAPIDVESLTTQSSSIITTNGHIAGTLSNSLQSVLTATNGPIKINVNLTSTEQSNATLVAHTTNSPISAGINLISSVGTGGTFFVSTTTTNSPLSVEFLTSPVNSTLHLAAQTTNSPATVSLHPAYEGSFDIITSRYLNARVHYKVPVPEDPAGKGRSRGSHSEGNKNEIHGEVYWGKFNERQANGTVIVRTTNSPVLLDI